MTQEHTATPWNIGEYEDVYGADGEMVHVKGFALSKRGVANAAFIVTAVNSYASSQAEIALLREELACTYEELIEVNGDDMIDSRASRVAELRSEANP